jgi:Ni,Fe-hydrogenase III large subunit
MHFHLPKPLHGWREFAGEVAVIVIGVVIALTAQQIVEDAHWRGAVKQSIEGMTKDAGEEHEALLARYKQEPCIRRRLADIGLILSRHDEGRPLGVIGPIGRPFYNSGSAESWDVAVADGSVAHLSFEDRTRFNQAFSIYRLFERSQWEEKRAWQQLQMLNHVANFTPDDWSQARQAYDLASDFNASLQATSSQYLYAFRTYPVVETYPPVKPPAFQIALCRPMVARQSN